MDQRDHGVVVLCALRVEDHHHPVSPCVLKVTLRRAQVSLTHKVIKFLLLTREGSLFAMMMMITSYGPGVLSPDDGNEFRESVERRRFRLAVAMQQIESRVKEITLRGRAL